MKNLIFPVIAAGALFCLLLFSGSTNATAKASFNKKIAFNEAGNNNISQPKENYIYTGGTILSVAPFSLVLSGGVNVKLNSETVCSVPGKKNDGGSMRENIIPCSSLFTGETVRVKAVKVNTGQILAVAIEEVFF